MNHVTRWSIVFLVVMQCVVLAGMLRRDGPFDHVGMDYLTTWVASDMLLHGEARHLYDTRAQWAAELPIIEQYNVHWDDRVMHPYLAPPLLAIFALPLGLLSPVVALTLWMLLAIGAVALAVRGMASAFEIDWREIAPLVFGSMPLFVLVMLGQADGLLALSFAAFVVLLRRGHEGRAGMALAVLALKPQLLLAPIVYLAITGRRRALIAAALTGLVEAVISFAVIGIGGVRDELAVSRRMAGPAGDAVINVPGMLNIRAAVFRLLPSDLTALQGPLVVGLTLLVLVISARIWRQSDAREVSLFGIGLLAITTVLTALHAHYHTGVIALLGVGLVAAALRERGDGHTARRLTSITWVSFSVVPFLMYVFVESSRAPAALGTVILIGVWVWLIRDLAPRRRGAQVGARVPAQSAQMSVGSSGDRQGG